MKRKETIGEEDEEKDMTSARVDDDRVNSSFSKFFILDMSST